MGSFNDLETVTFQNIMKPYAVRIYERLFPCCAIQDLREEGINVHILDKEFGIDSLINLKAGHWISLQEKYRQNEYLKYGDFTQEYKNAEGTEWETQGEWFKLAAQLYFYGWANKDNSDFEKWVILDVAKYKLIVDNAGGLDAIGKKRFNYTHGKASFYAIPLYKLNSCIVKSSDDISF